MALFYVVIQERKWRKEDPSQASINRQFDLTLSQLAVLAPHGSYIKTPTARNAVWNEEAKKAVRDSWSEDRMRCHKKSQLKKSGCVVGIMSKADLRCVIRVVCRKTNGEVNIGHENTTMVVWICGGV